MKGISFGQKIQSMSFVDILDAMVTGLERQWVNVDMNTYGDSYHGKDITIFGKRINVPLGKTCFGCAATNTICQILNEPIPADSIYYRSDRRAFIHKKYQIDCYNHLDLKYFEHAIDALRLCNINTYSFYAECIGIASIPEEWLEEIKDLPLLTNNDWKKGLPKWRKLVDRMKDKGVEKPN